MKVTFFGIRGTSPVTGPRFAVYGGETTSVLIEGAGGGRIAIDAGTGIRKLGERLLATEQPSELLLLMSHYHLDHVMGLPAFQPLYRKWRITIASPRRSGRAVEQVVPRIMAQPFWPLQIDNVQAEISFTTLDGAASTRPFRWKNLRVRWASVHHPGGCTAYRIDEPKTGASFVFATDLEWEESSPEEKDAFRRLCAEPKPPALLALDGHFSSSNYREFRGWGHSTWEDAVAAAREVEAKKLLVIHHAPENDDRQLEAIEKRLKQKMEHAALARGGMEVGINN